MVGATGCKAEGCLQTALSARKRFRLPCVVRVPGQSWTEPVCGQMYDNTGGQMKDTLQRKEVGGREKLMCTNNNLSVMASEELSPLKQNLPARHFTSPQAMCV